MVGKTSNSATKQPIPQEAFDWYDEYAHGKIDRREFLNRLAGLAVLGFSVATLTEALLPDYAKAEQVSFNDPDIKASYQTFPSPKGHGEGKGYLVVPTQLTTPLPVVLVVHENRGLNPYIKDVARRLAKQGFVAFAPDALAPVGGYPGNDDQGRERQKNLDRAKIEQDFIAAAQYLKTHTLSNGKLGAVGFCFGGYVVNMLAAVMGEQLNAGVPFYGTPAEKSLRADIKAPLQLHFAELDQRVNATWPDYEQDLKAINARYNAFIYPKVNHGFHNDSTARYAPEEAELAWQRTVEFFRRELKS
ncbi:TPA: dienelactone hydrolase family protein [Vibrio vulnificus]|uniref:dienelactone hydrolase family protein n=1 Tax=Vibrio vulnificus TaxID=672 RepID=UPI0019D4A0C6|nr:dienelactone hydrolase family protein [Vibrio vulnificus]EJT0551813.1 dienelactone hydrolase family protein [Vibrio vulnificus]ELV8657008.1 dienelactone hydrolase family protein [Vibrio vulnificus]MBN8131482.1 dienelactone hydrolase family protein [Vibrio vulnificus]MBN8135690.1 dienelactone hydrolase family protein [Vibrio vulnificus]MBN8158805.1 dienelactone hydrolase family protein [Vibrio vulnificus]